MNHLVKQMLVSCWVLDRLKLTRMCFDQHFKSLSRLHVSVRSLCLFFFEDECFWWFFLLHLRTTAVLLLHSMRSRPMTASPPLWVCVRHVFSQSFFVTKRFLLPPQPLYQKWVHLPRSLSKDHIFVYSWQPPVSCLSRQTAGGRQERDSRVTLSTSLVSLLWRFTHLFLVTTSSEFKRPHWDVVVTNHTWLHPLIHQSTFASVWFSVSWRHNLMRHCCRNMRYTQSCNY